MPVCFSFIQTLFLKEEGEMILHKRICKGMIVFKKYIKEKGERTFGGLIVCSLPHPKEIINIKNLPLWAEFTNEVHGLRW